MQVSGIAIITVILVILPKFEAYSHRDVFMDAQRLLQYALMYKAVKRSMTYYIISNLYLTHRHVEMNPCASSFGYFLV